MRLTSDQPNPEGTGHPFFAVLALGRMLLVLIGPHWSADGAGLFAQF